ncbi:MAG TPA: hypothetical protein EYQ42_02960 [Thiotrichaceae bacterium]|jgi:hypothetical protein|nr:hypothetical protein [Thiotrichaceae bacterium]HIM08430.1 hypothetical protein [Gammaproteobacteria bacterium]
MTNLQKGSFSINLGIVSLEAELADEDRQCAWELYTELITRVAVIGKIYDDECTNFEGELYIESLDSLFNFFQEARKIMRSFPAGQIKNKNINHLGMIINSAFITVLRPFLEKWQIQYRHWWDNESDESLMPLERQKQFPELKEFLDDWSDLRYLMKSLQNKLVEIYELTDVTK